MTDQRQFVLIEPAERRLSLKPFADLSAALAAVGLHTGEIDFGSLMPDHSIVVYEFGLFEPPAQQHYFALGKNLYAGNAVVFAEVEGKPSDVTKECWHLLRSNLRWFDSVQEIEKAIDDEEIIQPSISVDGKVVWVWPQPRPSYRAN